MSRIKEGFAEVVRIMCAPFIYAYYYTKWSVDKTRMLVRISYYHTLRSLGIGNGRAEGVKISQNVVSGNVAMLIEYSSGRDASIVLSAESAREVGRQLIAAVESVNI